jgi:hypothetical protein
MKTRRYLVVLFLAITFGWQARVIPAENTASDGMSPVAGDQATTTAQGGQAYVRQQTIRVEPVDSRHVRLRIEGRDNWVVESAGFELLPGAEALRVVADRGANTINPADPSVAETFELSIKPNGGLAFQITNAKKAIAPR